jgi:AcrR family transcriptional regulator
VSSTATLPIRQRRKEARPAELTAAALDLFVERGFAATKLDDIAARAGVSKGTLYLYFSSKEDLFKAVIQQGILPVLDEGEALMATHSGDAMSLLRMLLLSWWQMVGATRLAGVSKLMIAESGNFPEVARFYYENVIVRGRDLVRQALHRGIAAGEFRSVDIESTIDVTFSPLLMLAIWRYSLGPCACGQQDPEIYLNTHLDLLLNGLAESKP